MSQSRDGHGQTKALFFLDDGALLLQGKREIVMVDDRGEVRRRFPPCARAARSQHGRRVLCEGWFDLPNGVDLEEAARSTLCVLNLDDGYEPRLPPELPTRVPTELSRSGNPRWVDVATNEYRDLPFGRAGWPASLRAWTRDARFWWIGFDGDGEDSGPVEVDSGRPDMIISDLDPGAVASAPAVDVGGEADQNHPDASAIARTSDGQWLFFGYWRPRRLGSVAEPVLSPTQIAAHILGRENRIRERIAQLRRERHLEGASIDLEEGLPDDAPLVHVVRNERRPLLWVTGAVVAAAFSADGTVLAVATPSDEICLINLSSERLVRRFSAAWRAS